MRCLYISLKGWQSWTQCLYTTGVWEALDSTGGSASQLSDRDHAWHTHKGRAGIETSHARQMIAHWSFNYVLTHCGLLVPNCFSQYWHLYLCPSCRRNCLIWKRTSIIILTPPHNVIPSQCGQWARCVPTHYVLSSYCLSLSRNLFLGVCFLLEGSDT